MADTVRITIPVACNLSGKRVGGVNLDDESVGFQGQYSPFMNNMIVESGRVRKRQGYKRIGTGAAMSGIGCALINYSDAVGEHHFIAITTTKAYQYNKSTSVWDDITDISEDWTGDADDRFAHAVVTDANMFTNNEGTALCVVNNVNDVKYFEGDASDKFTTLVHTFPAFSTCREIVEFWGHLMFLGFTDTAARVRSLGFAGLLDVDDWTGAASGITTLTDTQGRILRAEKLGYDLFIYSGRSISRAQYAGSSLIFAIPVVVQDCGILSDRSLCSNSLAHFFLSTDQKVYTISQSGDLTDIGKRVDTALFTDTVTALRNRIATGFDVGRRKVMFFIPTEGESYSKVAYVVSTDMDGMPWERYTMGHDVRDMTTMIQIGEGVYCDDPDWADLYCDKLPGYCDDNYGKDEQDLACFISSDGYVFALSESFGYDDTKQIDCEYQTEDVVFADEEDYVRALWFSFTAYSALGDSDVYVQYSTNGGKTWASLEGSPVTITEDWKTYRLPLDVTTRRIRFRLSQTGFGDLQLRSNFRIEVVPLTSRD